MGHRWNVNLGQRCFSLGVISLAVGAAFGCFAVGGCARQLTITQADYINTAMQRDRDAEDRTGEPLEVNIVCVYPKDLDKPRNAALSPDTRITSDVWYKNRPTLERVAGGTAFDLPADQVYLLTDQKEVYGRPIGSSLRGAKIDGQEPMEYRGIRFKGLFDKRSVIYVFPRFIGEDRKVEPVAPVKLHPPGAYPRDLYVEIGVEDPKGKAIQYVKNRTVRKLGRDRKARN